MVGSSPGLEKLAKNFPAFSSDEYALVNSLYTASRSSLVGTPWRNEMNIDGERPFFKFCECHLEIRASTSISVKADV